MDLRYCTAFAKEISGISRMGGLPCSSAGNDSIDPLDTCVQVAQREIRRQVLWKPVSCFVCPGSAPLPTHGFGPRTFKLGPWGGALCLRCMRHTAMYTALSLYGEAWDWSK